MSFLSRLFKKRSRKELKLGLALGAGGARGFAHIGVLKVLQEAGISIHCIAGTSAGAMAGGMLCSGVSTEEMTNIAIHLSARHRITKLLMPTFERGGLLDGDRIKKIIEPLVEGKQIEDLYPKFACVGTDLYSGERVVFKKGSALDAIRASTAIPGVFTPAHMNGRVLVDGGVLDPVPVGLAYELGANFVIAVNVIRPPRDEIFFRKNGNGAELDNHDREKKPSTLEVILTALALYEHNIFKLRIQSEKPDMLIEPNIEAMTVFDFNKGAQAIDAGEAAMRAHLPRILKLI